MSKIARALTFVAGVAVAARLDAGSPLPGFSLKAATRRFAFYTRGSEAVDIRKSEEFLTRMERLLGARVDGRTAYYRYASPEEVAAATGTYGTGVTFASSREIHTTQGFHAHEIVHLVAGQLGEPGAFFQEGLAVV